MLGNKSDLRETLGVALVDQEVRQRRSQATTRWSKKNPDKRKAIQARASRKLLYGVTETDFQSMLKWQGNKCPGCDRIFSDELKPHVDHDHKTKKVRGLLCHMCNLAVGSAGDSGGVLRSLADYLDENWGSEWHALNRSAE